MNQQNGYQKEYEEIDLINYLKVILKRKWLILTVFLVVVIGIGIVSFLTPKVYKIDTSLEIGTIGGQPLEHPLQVAEKINSDVYGRVVGIKATNPPYTNLVNIETTSKEPQKIKEILGEIERSILTEHNNKIDYQKSLLEKEIEKLQEKMNFLISQNQKETVFLQLEIKNLQWQKETIQPTKIIKEPTVSEKPVRPKTFLNIVIAAVLGIFIGVVSAFFKEWWDKNKAR